MYAGACWLSRRAELPESWGVPYTILPSTVELSTSSESRAFAEPNLVGRGVNVKGHAKFPTIEVISTLLQLLKLKMTVPGATSACSGEAL